MAALGKAVSIEDVTKAVNAADDEANQVLQALKTFQIGRTVLYKGKDCVLNGVMLADTTANVRQTCLALLGDDWTKDDLRAFLIVFKDLPSDGASFLLS